MRKILLFAAAVTACGVLSAQNSYHFGAEAGYDHSWLEYSVTDVRLNTTESSGIDMNGFHAGPTMRMDFKEGRFVPSLTFGLIYQFMESAYPFGYTKKEYKDLVKDGKEAFKEAGAEKIRLKDVLVSHSIQVPVNARFTFSPSDRFGVFAFTGPMLNFYTARRNRVVATAEYDGKKNGSITNSSWLKNEVKSTKWEDGKKSETDMTDPDADKFSNIFNMYWNLGAGVNFCNHFSASVSYETCLSNQSYLTSVSIGGMTEEYDLRDSFLKISFGYTF